MSIISNLVARLSCDSTQFEKGTSNARKSLKDLAAESTAATKELTNLTKTALEIVGIDLGVGAIVGQVESWIDAAKDATRTQRVFQIALGDNAAAAGQWADSYARSAGVCEIETRKFLTGFSLVGQEMGLSAPQTLQMSQAMVRLTNDVASFAGIAPEEAFRKLDGALMGNYKGLRDLGVVMKETDIQQYALNQGWIEEGQQLSKAQEEAARYNVLLEATSKMHGDLARSAGTVADEERRLKEEWQSTKVELGTSLLPVYNQALKTLHTTLQEHKQDLRDIAEGIGIAGNAMLRAEGALASGSKAVVDRTFDWAQQKGYMQRGTPEDAGVVLPPDLRKQAWEDYRQTTGDVGAFRQGQAPQYPDVWQATAAKTRDQWDEQRGIASGGLTAAQRAALQGLAEPSPITGSTGGGLTAAQLAALQGLAEPSPNTEGVTALNGPQMLGTLDLLHYTPTESPGAALSPLIPTDNQLAQAAKLTNEYERLQNPGGATTKSKQKEFDADVEKELRNLEMEAESLGKTNEERQRAVVLHRLEEEAIRKKATFSPEQQGQVQAAMDALQAQRSQAIVTDTQREIANLQQLNAAMRESSLTGSALTEYQRLLNEEIKAGVPITAELKEQLQQLAKAEAEAKQGYANNDFFGGMRQGVQDFKMQLSSVGQIGQEVALKGLKGISDAITKSVFEAKSLSDAFRQLALQLAEMAFQKSLEGLMGGLIPGGGGGGGGGGGLGGILGSLLGGGGGAAAGATGFESAGQGLAMLDMFEMGMMHSGGTAGVDSSGTRTLPSWSLAFAPRLHTGLMADEFPAVLQRGEKVTSASGVGAENRAFDQMVDLLKALVNKDTNVTLVDRRPTAKDYLASREGEQQVMRHVARNK
jgi:hypothetical protein